MFLSVAQRCRSLQFTKESVQDASALVPGLGSGPKSDTRVSKLHLLFLIDFLKKNIHALMRTENAPFQMDKFLSGFGFGNMSTPAAKQPPDSTQTLNSNVTSPKKDPAKVMGQAPKVCVIADVMFCPLSAKDPQRKNV